MRAKIVATIAVAVLLFAVAIGWALTRRSPPVQADPSVTLRTPGVLVRDTATGRLAVIRPDGTRAQTAVSCSRAYAAGGHAICLHRDGASPSTFQLTVLDPGLTELRSVPINGVPTRARVSADGRMLAWTVFVAGDSYASTTFSTRTGLLDLATDAVTTTLEDFTVAGHKPPADANFWGVSFAADDNTFFATMATGSHFYLVQGDFAAETLAIIGDGVECPSLSPDGTRLVYKKRQPDRTWRLWVLDLDTKERTPLAEPGNVDDQAAWLDDKTIAYGKAEENTGQFDVWSVPADGTGSPAELAEHAESPAILR